MSMSAMFAGARPMDDSWTSKHNLYSQFSGRSAANAALNTALSEQLVSRGRVAGDQGQDAPQRAALIMMISFIKNNKGPVGR